RVLGVKTHVRSDEMTQLIDGCSVALEQRSAKRALMRLMADSDQLSEEVLFRWIVGVERGRLEPEVGRDVADRSAVEAELREAPQGDLQDAPFGAILHGRAGQAGLVTLQAGSGPRDGGHDLCT